MLGIVDWHVIHGHTHLQYVHLLHAQATGVATGLGVPGTGIVRLGWADDEGRYGIWGAGCSIVRLGWEMHGGRVDAVCRGSTTLAWSVACVCAQSWQTCRHGLFLRYTAGYVWEPRGQTRGWGSLTMRSFRINQDFRASAHGSWSPTHCKDRKPVGLRPLSPCCTAPIPYCLHVSVSIYVRCVGKLQYNKL